MVLQICPECHNKWYYSGKSKYVTCTECFKSWTLSADEIEQHKHELGIYELEEEGDEDERPRYAQQPD